MDDRSCWSNHFAVSLVVVVGASTARLLTSTHAFCIRKHLHKTTKQNNFDCLIHKVLHLLSTVTMHICKANKNDNTDLAGDDYSDGGVREFLFLRWFDVDLAHIVILVTIYRTFVRHLRYDPIFKTVRNVFEDINIYKYA